MSTNLLVLVLVLVLVDAKKEGWMDRGEIESGEEWLEGGCGV